MLIEEKCSTVEKWKVLKVVESLHFETESSVESLVLKT